MPPNSRVQNGVNTLTGSANGSYVAEANLSQSAANVRKQLASDYTTLLDQISSIARDSHYNGNNLLAGGVLDFVFNEKATSSHQVKGFMADATSLGLKTALDGNFLDPQSIGDAVKQISGLTEFLQIKASELSKDLSIASTRDDFTTKMMSVLQIGADALTLADLNREATNATALSVRQQLATNSLTLASQAQQAILQLLK